MIVCHRKSELQALLDQPVERGGTDKIRAMLEKREDKSGRLRPQNCDNFSWLLFRIPPQSNDIGLELTLRVYGSWSSPAVVHFD
jgi:hypothetical protein